jgi:hypothetical protein
MQDKKHLTPIGGHSNVVPKELISGVSAMQVVDDPKRSNQTEHKFEGKERVSFGTNMSTEEEVSDSGLESKNVTQLTTAIERFHSRKFGSKAGSSADKKAILKISNSVGVKKQRTPNKACMQGAVQMLEQERLEGLIDQATKNSGEPMEVVRTDDVSMPELDPKNLTDSQDEVSHEQ